MNQTNTLPQNDRPAETLRSSGWLGLFLTMNKAYNATRDGQVAMANDAASRAPAFQMNKIIKSKGGVGWPDDMIASAEPILLRSIKENLIEEYNAIVSNQ